MLFSFGEEQTEPAPQASSWIDRMREQYHATGEVKPADVLRLLGDPSQGVSMEIADATSQPGFQQRFQN